MNWQKLGLIFSPNNNYKWMATHAANPVPVQIGEGMFRVYFTCRDNKNRSHIGFVDVDFNNDFKVVNICDEPVLEPGELGMFDDSGVAMGYYIEIDSLPHIYYLGWNLKVTVPWLNTIGLAKYDEISKKFVKVSKAPIMDRSNEDPFSISYPSIIKECGIYKMWYGSNLNWGETQDEMNHVIKYAESNDGYVWKRSNKIAVNLSHRKEYALSKPYVIKDNGIYKMWYSYRGCDEVKTYRIGFAESLDGVSWKRKDEICGITVSDQGWDSEMICYPSVVDYKGDRFMLYNGNGYGATGFGIAKLIGNDKN